MMQIQNSCLICVDFINEMVDHAGKLAAKGYAEFADRHATLQNARAAQTTFREQGALVVHVHVGFDASYVDHPAQSILLGKAQQAGALQLGTWNARFAAPVEPQDGDVVMRKPRVSAFYGTPLEALLRARGITEVFVCGVATDLAVESTVRDAHDRDYTVNVLEDCSVAATDEDHQRSLSTMRKLARVVTVADVLESSAAAT